MTNKHDLIKWSKAIKDKDNHTCVNCGSKSKLRSHHIESVKKRPDLALDLNNGITLCQKCHTLIHIENGDIISRHIDIVYLVNNINKILKTDYSLDELSKIQKEIIKLRVNYAQSNEYKELYKNKNTIALKTYMQSMKEV